MQRLLKQRLYSPHVCACVNTCGVCVCVRVSVQEGQELSAKAKADAAVKNEAIKAQLARQLADRANAEQQEKQEEMDYAQLEQV